MVIKKKAKKKVVNKRAKEEVGRELTDDEITEALKQLEENEELKKDGLSKYPKVQVIRGVQYIRGDLIKKNEEDDVWEYTDEFLFDAKKKGKWYLPWTWFGDSKKDGKGNILLLMDNEMGIRVFDNVQPGIFRIKEFEGTEHERENYILLKPNKLRTYVDKKGNLIRLWISDINNAVALPDEPVYSSKSVSEAIRVAVTDRQRFENVPKKSWWKKNMWIVPAILIFLYFLWYFGLLDKILASFNAPSTSEVVDKAKDGVKDIAGGTLNFIWLMFGRKTWLSSR